MSVYSLCRRLIPFRERETEYLTLLPAITNDRYVLRMDQEKKLYLALCQSNRHILLCGPGGCGKTHMARRLFYRFRNKYRRMAWLEYGTDMGTTLTEGFPDYKCIKDPDLRFSKIIQMLAEDPDDTILFIDDVKENATEDDILSQITGIGITILMTSRCKCIPPYETWELDAISSAECTDLFYAHYARDPQREHKKTVHSLATQLEQNVFAMLLLAQVVGKPENLSQIAEGVSKCEPTGFIGKLLEYVKLPDEEVLVLQCFSLLPSGELLPQTQEWFGFTTEILYDLVKKGWLDYNDTTKRFILHDLVREYFWKMKLPRNVINGFLEVALSDDFLSSHGSEEAIEYKISSMKRALEWTEYLNPLFVYALLCLGRYYRKKGFYFQAKDFAEQALATANSIPDCSFDLLDLVHRSVGDIYDECGMYEQAIQHYHLSEKYCEAQSECNPLSQATLWNNMGISYGNLGRHDEALKYLNRALRTKLDILGRDNSKTAASYDNIGINYARLGDKLKALENHKLALEITERSLGRDNADTVGSYNNVGVTLVHLHKYEEALEYFKTAKEISERIHGDDHPITATTYDNLSSAYANMNNPEQALKYATAAALSFRRTLGELHPKTEKSLRLLQRRLKKVYPDITPKEWLTSQSQILLKNK